MVATIGAWNRNRQFLMAKTNLLGTDNRQYVWIVECHAIQDEEVCGKRYGVNGTDFFQRLCPRCQGGREGLKFDGHRLNYLHSDS